MPLPVLRQLLSLLLLLLIAMQSIALKADVHQFHQPASDISSSEHNPTLDHQHADLHVKQVQDCHHCCHCHGGHHLYLLVSLPQLTVNAAVALTVDHSDRVSHAVHIPAIRPPIA